MPQNEKIIWPIISSLPLTNVSVKTTRSGYLISFVSRKTELQLPAVPQPVSNRREGWGEGGGVWGIWRCWKHLCYDLYQSNQSNLDKENEILYPL
jgi:hypothetical protein